MKVIHFYKMEVALKRCETLSYCMFCGEEDVQTLKMSPCCHTICLECILFYHHDYIAHHYTTCRMCANETLTVFCSKCMTYIDADDTYDCKYCYMSVIATIAHGYKPTALQHYKREQKRKYF